MSDTATEYNNTVTAAGESNPAAAIHSAATAYAELAKAEQAAQTIARAMVDKALASLKRKAKAIRRDANGLFVADIAGLPMTERKVLAQHMADPRVQEVLADLFAREIADAPMSLGELTITAVGLGQNDRFSNELGRKRHDRTHDQALPYRRAGIRSPAGLAGLRVLRAVGVDDRSRDAAGVLPDLRRDDVRRGGPVHLEVRGASADRLIDTAGIAAAATSGQASGHRDPGTSRGLREQAEDAALDGAHQPAWPKGRADTSDGTVSGQGRDDHGR